MEERERDMDRIRRKEAEWMARAKCVRAIRISSWLGVSIRIRAVS